LLVLILQIVQFDIAGAAWSASFRTSS
jgi:hypothetical protein